MSYNESSYTPEDGISLRIRCIDQNGNTYNLTYAQFVSMGLSLEYVDADKEVWTELPVGGSTEDIVSEIIPTTAFLFKQDVIVRLVRKTQQGKKVLAQSTIYCVNGTGDTNQREWIFLRSETDIVFGGAGSEYLEPSLIAEGEVNPSAAASGDETDKNKACWVPNGWWADEYGVDGTFFYEYAAYRDFIRDEEGGHWGEFTDAFIWHHYRESSVAYDIVPNVTVINANSEGVVDSKGIIVCAYMNDGKKRSENILPEYEEPQGEQHYYVEYHIDNEKDEHGDDKWTPCGGFNYYTGPEDDIETLQVYGIAPEIVKTATDKIALRLKHSSKPDVVLKENAPINVVKSISKEEVEELIEEQTTDQYLSKTHEDEAQEPIGFWKGLWVKVKGLFGIDEDGNLSVANAAIGGDAGIEGSATVGVDLSVGGKATIEDNLNVNGSSFVEGDSTVKGTLFANQSVHTDEIRSTNYTGDTVGDTGFLLTAGLNNGLGHSKLTVDEIYVRMKAVFESLEVRKWSVVAGDEIRSCAANIITRVDYYNAQGDVIGYSSVRVPWLFNRIPYLLKIFGSSAVQDHTAGRWVYSKMVNMRTTLKESDLQKVSFCRCFFLADDGDTRIENWWRADAENGYDLARCQTMNVMRTNRNTFTTLKSKAGNVFWWRKVLRVSSNNYEPVENPDNQHCQPALLDGKAYHWFDVYFDGQHEYNPTTGELDPTYNTGNSYPGLLPATTPSSSVTPPTQAA